MRIQSSRRIDDQDMWAVAPEDLLLSKLHWAQQLGVARLRK
jgi:hypothetical protein